MRPVMRKKTERLRLFSNAFIETAIVVGILFSLATRAAEGINFQVPFFVDGRVKVRSYNTAAGAADGERLLTGTRLVPSGADNLYIGIDRSTVSRITATGQVTDESAAKPELADWSMGVTYDSKANRVVLVTLGGEGFLYQRTPDGQWSSIASMQQEDLESLVYLPEENALYGIRVYTSSPEGTATLLKYSPTGEKIGQVQLPSFPVDLRPGDHTAKLVAAEGKIIALVERVPQNGLAPGDRSRIYVIDPDTATVQLTYDAPTVERSHAPTLAFTHPNSDGSSAFVNHSVTITLAASDADGDLSSVELSDGLSLLKSWVFDPAVSNGADLTFAWTPAAAGSHTLNARAADVRGNVTEKSIQINVFGPDPDPEPDDAFVAWYYKGGAAIEVKYTPAGPVEEGPLFRGLHLAKDQGPNRYLGRDGHTIFHWDNETAVYKETAPPGEFSWARGTAYDSERNRFIVVTLGGEGFLYAVDPNELEWSIVRSMDNVDVDSTVYHSADDHLYMVANHGGTVRILPYNAEGQPDGRTISIADVPLDVGSFYQSRLISVGGKLALLIEPTPGWPVTPPVESRIYMVDPANGASELTYRKVWDTWPPQPSPNTAPVVKFKQPVGDISVSRGDTVQVVVEVSDPENDLYTATLFLAGTTLKTWTFENAQGAQTLSFEFAADQVGTRPISLRAMDARRNSAEASVQLTVTDTAVSFVGLYYKNEHVISVDYTEKGPRDGGTLYRGLPVAQAGYRYLGRDGHTVFRWDNENDEYTETAPAGGLSWPRGTSWDHRRNRFLVVTLGGEGFLYALDPVTLQWTTVASMENVDVDSIVYHHLDDHLYMVEDRGGFLKILRYDSQGKPAGSIITIWNVPLDLRVYYQSRLISTGSKLALLIEPAPGFRPSPPVESRIYMIDPVARTADLTYRKVWETWPPQPPPPATVTVERDLPESYMPGVLVTVKLIAKPTSGVTAWAVEEQPPTGWVFGQASHDGVYDQSSGKIKFGPFTDSVARTLTYTVFPPTASTGSKTFTGIVSVNGVSMPTTGDTTIVDGSQRHHPAEAPPQDDRITVDELTAYAAAWKSGAQWPRPPAAIPIAYLTRAGQIWRSGEFYNYNPRLERPTCWVPANQPVPIAAFLAAPIINEVTRNLPPAFTPGRTTTVSVTVRPAAGVQSYAIEERPPTGWAIAQAEGAAVVNGSLRYGPFLDDRTRTFTYQVVPTAASVSGEFSGASSFDGSSDGVQGACVLTAPSGTAEHRDGQVYLRFNATPGEHFILESANSVDTPVWTYEATIEGAQSATELPPVEPAANLKFYRLRPVAQ